MYYPKHRVPYNFNAYQLNVLKSYFRNAPYLSTSSLRKVYETFKKEIPMIHIKYWFINEHNFYAFKKLLPKQNSPIPKLIVPESSRSSSSSSFQRKRKADELNEDQNESKKQKIQKMDIKFLLN
jgi:hypothetical protein